MDVELGLVVVCRGRSLSHGGQGYVAGRRVEGVQQGAELFGGRDGFSNGRQREGSLPVFHQPPENLRQTKRATGHRRHRNWPCSERVFNGRQSAGKEGFVAAKRAVSQLQALPEKVHHRIRITRTCQLDQRRGSRRWSDDAGYLAERDHLQIGTDSKGVGSCPVRRVRVCAKSPHDLRRGNLDHDAVGPPAAAKRNVTRGDGAVRRVEDQQVVSVEAAD